jgi:DnaK suppressor protein
MLDIRIPASLTQPEKPYMNPEQLAYFREKLLSWRGELDCSLRRRIRKIHQGDDRPIEDMERCAQAFDREIEISNQIRTRQLILRIDEALERIDTGTYGYCMETEEPIGLERLAASPVAAHCLSVQERMEQKKNKIPRGAFFNPDRTLHKERPPWRQG